MKKVLSVLICALIMVSAFCVSASAANTLTKSYDEAKDGELLYDVVFNATDGVFKPGVISSTTASEASTAVASADGKTVTITHCDGDNARYWWGGAVEGLTLGEGKSYTLTGKIKITGINAGVYFNNAGTEYSKLYGFYGGRGDKDDFTLAKGGGKTKGTVMVDGKLKCDGSAYAQLDFQGMQKASADGYVEFTIVVENYDFSVYFNGELFDKHAGTAEEFATSGNVGVGFYVYNKNASIEATNFKLYKGNLLTVQPDAPATGAPSTGTPSTGSPSTGDNGVIGIAIVALVAIFGGAVTCMAVREK